VSLAPPMHDLSLMPPTTKASVILVSPRNIDLEVLRFNTLESDIDAVASAISNA